MKKKSLFLFVATALLLSVSVVTASKTWYMVNDSCNNCKVNFVDRECGKCGGFLKQDGKDEVRGGFLITTYKCKDCSHTCIFKVKY